MRSVTAAEVLSSMYAGLEIDPASDTSHAALFAAVLRRLCGIMCPCAQFMVLRAAKQSFSGLLDCSDQFEEHLEQALEDLIVAGDVLELSAVAAAGAAERSRWLYCAPPSFVVRSTQRVYVFGVAPDDAAFLPSELRQSTAQLGASRFIETSDAESVRSALRQFGLREIAKDDWMVKVRPETPTRFLERAKVKLEREGVAGDLPELVVLAPGTNNSTSYRNRWKPVFNEEGLFIGRSPQPYGQPLWYLCELQKGKVRKSLLLPHGEARDRASDAAWRLQLAIDATAQAPSRYTCRPHEGGFALQFQFPLPLPARRRLEFLGGRTYPGADNPFAFWVPAAELQAEVKFLREHYWLKAVMQEE